MPRARPTSKRTLCLVYRDALTSSRLPVPHKNGEMHHLSFPTMPMSQDEGFDRKVFPGAVPVCKPSVEKAAWLSGIWEKVPNLNVISIAPTTSGDTTLVDDATVELGNFDISKDEDSLVDSAQPESKKDDPTEWQERESGDALWTSKDWTHTASSSPPRLVTTATTSRLKAAAPAFVPAFRRPSAALASEPVPRVSYMTGATGTSAWLAAFESGVTSLYPTVRRFEASALVKNCAWTDEQIGHLAHLFCQEGSRGIRAERSVASKFALQVRDQLRCTCGEWTAQMFSQCLRDAVLKTFFLWWRSSSSTSIYFGRSVDAGDLSSALCLATFIGDLSLEGLLSFNAVQRCIWTLLHELHSIEHLFALHLLLKHATVSLWKGAPGRTAKFPFLNKFVFKARRIQDDASVVGTNFSKAEVCSLIVSINELVSPTFGTCLNNSMHHERATQQEQEELGLPVNTKS